MATHPVAEPAVRERLAPRRIGIDTFWDYAVLLTFVALFVALFAVVAWVVLVGPPGGRD